MSERLTMITGRTRKQAVGMHKGKDSPEYHEAIALVETNLDDTAWDPGAHFADAAAAHPERIPTIVLDHGPCVVTSRAHVLFPMAAYGVDAAGTAYRIDNVHKPLTKVISTGRVTVEEVLCQIIEAVA